MRRRARKKFPNGKPKSRRFIIPRAYKFPFGWRIKIRRILSSEMLDIYACKHCGLTDGEPSDGTWDVHEMTIWIDRTIPIRRQRAIFLHEYHHAYKDWELWVRNSGKAAD